MRIRQLSESRTAATITLLLRGENRCSDLLALGTLIVTIATTAGSLVSRRRRSPAGWDEARTVRLEIDGDVLEITDASGEQLERLVTLWTERHAAAP